MVVYGQQEQRFTFEGSFSVHPTETSGADLFPELDQVSIVEVLGDGENEGLVLV